MCLPTTTMAAATATATETATATATSAALAFAFHFYNGLRLYEPGTQVQVALTGPATEDKPHTPAHTHTQTPTQ